MSTRYFLSTHTSSPVQTDAGVVQFEPVAQFAGSWYGIYATDDSAIAKALASASGVDEIDKARYENEKKKVPGYTDSPAEALANSQPARPAEPAVPPTNPFSFDLRDPRSVEGLPPPSDVNDIPLIPVESVELPTTTEEPPADSVIDEEGEDGKKKARFKNKK